MLLSILDMARCIVFIGILVNSGFVAIIVEKHLIRGSEINFLRLNMSLAQ